MTRRLTIEDLESELSTLEAWALAPADTHDDLIRNLSGVYHALLSLEPHRFDPGGLVEVAPRMITRLFEARMNLRARLPAWHGAGFLSPYVQRGLRDIFRAMRYGADMLGEAAIGFRKLDGGVPQLRAFSGRNTNTLINPRFDEKQDLPFRSGDILLVRGKFHNSAAIARIGDIDSQFSHVGIVYIDPEGYHWLVEVLIADGGIIKPLDQALSDDLGRAMVLRHTDQALAQRAGFIAYEHVKQSLSRYGKPIRYDFTMQNGSYKRLYCSKLIRLAFDKASEGQVMLSTFPTQLQAINRDFFDRIGVTASQTFAPGDMELEPNFDVVAEWQDYRFTAALRHQDIVMDKLFEWMETGNLHFEETFLVRMISRFGRLASGFSNTIKTMIADVVPKVPSHMPRKTIATIVMLHRTAEPLMEELATLERDRIRTFGVPLHPREIADSLDTWREKNGPAVGYLAPRTMIAPTRDVQLHDAV